MEVNHMLKNICQVNGNIREAFKKIRNFIRS